MLTSRFFSGSTLQNEHIAYFIIPECEPLSSACQTVHRRNSWGRPCARFWTRSRWGRCVQQPLLQLRLPPSMISVVFLLSCILHVELVPDCLSAAKFTYLFAARRILQSARALHVFIDAASVAKSPTELMFLWSPGHRLGAYAPPMVQSSAIHFCQVSLLAEAVTWIESLQPKVAVRCSGSSADAREQTDKEMVSPNLLSLFDQRHVCEAA